MTKPTEDDAAELKPFNAWKGLLNLIFVGFFVMDAEQRCACGKIVILGYSAEIHCPQALFP